MGPRIFQLGARFESEDTIAAPSSDRSLGLDCQQGTCLHSPLHGTTKRTRSLPRAKASPAAVRLPHGTAIASYSAGLSDAPATSGNHFDGVSRVIGEAQGGVKVGSALIWYQLPFQQDRKELT